MSADAVTITKDDNGKVYTYDNLRYTIGPIKDGEVTVYSSNRKLPRKVTCEHIERLFKEGRAFWGWEEDIIREVIVGSGGHDAWDSCAD